MCKEIAILNMDTGKHVHKLLNMPHTFDLFNKSIQNHMGWILRYINGLEWSSCHSDFLNYEEVGEFLMNELKDSDYVLVKGVEKKTWLEKFLKNKIITDLQEEDCESLHKLKLVFKSYHCNQHKYNDLNCALENVYFLYHWHKYCKKINV